jgi:hypothetical protein
MYERMVSFINYILILSNILSNVLFDMIKTVKKNKKYQKVNKIDIYFMLK